MAGASYRRLTPLIERRKCVEEEKQRILAARRHMLAENHDKLERLSALRARAVMLYEPTQPARVLELRVHDAHRSYLESAIDAQRRRIAELEAVVESARGELIVARRDRRVLEKLAERRLRAIEDDRERREQLELDEANARRWERAARQRRACEQAERATL